MLPVLLDASLPATVTGVVTDLFGVCDDVVTTVTNNAVMCIGIAAMIGGLGIKWYKKLTGQRR